MPKKKTDSVVADLVITAASIGVEATTGSKAAGFATQATAKIMGDENLRKKALIGLGVIVALPVLIPMAAAVLIAESFGGGSDDGDDSSGGGLDDGGSYYL